MGIIALRRTLPLAVLLVVAAAPAFADPDDDTDWAAFVPPVSTGTVVAPTTPEGGFGSSDRTKFGEKLRERVLDQVCRHLKLNKDFNFGPAEFSGTRVGVSRALGTYPDGTLAVVDDETVRASYGHTFGKVIGQTGATIGLSLGGTIEGHSMVVRRLNSKQSCSEIFRLANFADIKTVIPMTAERITAMELGELWRVPFTLTYGQGLGVGDSPAANVAASLSFGRTDTGTSSMTLFRLADDKVRFRFRIDHVVVYSKSAGVNEIFPAIAFAANAHNILLRLLEREVAKQLERYTAAWLNFGRSSSDGAMILMEFVVDPRDPAQADAMAHAMRGDILELVKMGVRMSTFHAGDAEALKDYGLLRDEHAKTLGDPTYAAANQYSAKMKSFSFNLPFFISHNASSLFGDDRVTRYTGEGGEYRFYRADKSKTNEYFNAPFVGALVKNSSQRDVEAVTYGAPGQPHGEPIVVYIRNEGYLREPGSQVRGDIENINSVLRRVGAQRGTANSRMVLPVDALVPPSPALPANGRDDEERPQEPSNRKGAMSFTLVFNQKAVRDVLAAPSEEVLKAFAASLDAADKPLMEWLIANGRLNAKGQLDYSRKAARNAFPDDSGDNATNHASDLAGLSKRAAGILADLAAGRNAKTNEERAEAVAKLVAGKGQSGMAYEEILQVLVQLVDPLDLTGDFVANIQSTSKSVKDANAHLVLKKGRPEVPLLREAGDTKGRFAQPSILVD